MNIKSLNGHTALHGAIISGDLKTIEKLVELGANVRAQDNDGDSPLHMIRHSKAEGEVTVQSPRMMEVPYHLSCRLLEHPFGLELVLNQRFCKSNNFFNSGNPRFVGNVSSNVTLYYTMQIKQELECFEDVTPHAVLACFLIKNGADIFLQNNAGITALQGLPIEVSAIAASFTQKHQGTVAS